MNPIISFFLYYYCLFCMMISMTNGWIILSQHQQQQQRNNYHHHCMIRDNHNNNNAFIITTVPPPSRYNIVMNTNHHHHNIRSLLLLSSSRLDHDIDNIDDSITTTSTTVFIEQESDNNNNNNEKTRSSTSSPTIQKSQSLFDISLSSSMMNDPEWYNMRIPFIEPTTSASNRQYNDNNDDNTDNNVEEYIDVKIAFMVELDGNKYAIAVPADIPVMIVKEEENGNNIQNLSPSNSDNDEIIEIMASRLYETYNNNDEDVNNENDDGNNINIDNNNNDIIALKRTPRVLTIVGPIEDRIQNWKTTVLPEPISTTELLNDDNEDIDSFHQFMKNELGEEEYKNTINNNNDDIDDIDDIELKELYNTLLNTNDNVINDDENNAIETLLNSMIENPNDDLTIPMEQILDNTFSGSTNNNNKYNSNGLLSSTSTMDHDGIALKLISYIIPSDDSKNSNKKNKTIRSYSLVKILKPYALVGKYIMNNQNNNIQFELLTNYEENIIIPKIEELFYNELKESGLQLFVQQ